MILNRVLLGWALLASLLATVGIWSAVNCRKPQAAPLPVEIEKIVYVDRVVEKKPAAGEKVLAGGDWVDEHERFHFRQKERELDVRQEFAATVSPDRKTAEIVEVSPKTGEVIGKREIPLPPLTTPQPAPKFRLEGGAYLADEAKWGAFARFTYKPSRFTFVSVERAGDTRVYGGLSIEF